LRAAQELQGRYPFELIIAGYGALVPEIECFIKENGIEDTVKFVGKVNDTEIAEQLEKTDAYLFSSTYETFSIACAQALCMGVPLVGPPLEPIMEYADNSSMVVVKDDRWVEALEELLQYVGKFNREAISIKYRTLFSKENFIKQYSVAINTLFANNTKHV
jgi:glycosyltransferase involved in cell wall biosynthesis